MIIVKVQGGLGNQLFQWAYGYSLSKEHEVYFDVSFYYSSENIGVVVDKRNLELNKIINTPINFLTQEVVEKLKNKNITIINDNFSYTDIVFDKNEIYFLNGYWQSEKFFKNHREDILASIQLPAFKDCDFKNSCSLHIRRGDYLNLRDIHPILPVNYYEKALEILNPSGNVFIFSDDIEWCKKNITHSNSIFIDGNSNIEDLAQMSNCKDNIIANSSFSWWGAWLNRNLNKRIICPKEWFGSNNSDDKDIRPENWVQI
jgi:hypothetical protein